MENIVDGCGPSSDQIREILDTSLISTGSPFLHNHYITVAESEKSGVFPQPVIPGVHFLFLHHYYE